MDERKGVANAAPDDRAHSAGYEGGTGAGESAIASGSADGGSNSRTDCTSDQNIHGTDCFARLEAHFAHSTSFVHNFVRNGQDNQDARTATRSARTDQLVFGCAQKRTGVANEKMVIADSDARPDGKILDCLPIPALRKAERTEKKGNEREQDSSFAMHGIVPFKDECHLPSARVFGVRH